MKLTPLASGSSGNSFLVQDNGAAFLVDAGLSAKQISERVAKAGVDPASLSGIIVSHGHSDHVKGVGVLSRKYKLPIYMNRATWQLVKDSVGKIHKTGNLRDGRIFDFAGSRSIHSRFRMIAWIQSDSAFSKGTRRLGIATDLGTATGW